SKFIGSGAPQVPSVDHKICGSGTIFLGCVIVFSLKHGRLVVDFLDTLNTLRGDSDRGTHFQCAQAARNSVTVPSSPSVPTASSRASALKAICSTCAAWRGCLL